MPNQDHKNVKLRSNTSEMNGVIVTVYVESPTAAPRRIKRARPIPSNGYDRRATLLAYAKDLRHGTPNLWPYYNKISTTKRNKRRLSSIPASLCRIFQRGRKYERLEPVDVEPKRSRIKGRHEKTRIDVKLCKMLRSIFKGLSSGGWRCNKG